ncbi:hypothetical protein [uncultured Pontibacter sp.]|uniref:hypothetical protein n=1 Tax=uncultured Pontibacter sp. TaxID=453356 RepID=UPI0026344A6E|nr:hypothetical protein [uncultured Pontibacter sp.]
MKALPAYLLQNRNMLLSRRNCLLVLGLSFLLVQVLLHYKFGVKIMYDSTRYIWFAKELEAGVWPGGYVNWYAAYCVVIFLAHVSGTGYAAVVLLQVIVAFAALYCLFQAVFELSGSLARAFVIAFLFGTSYQVQLWNTYILTESLFISCILIFAYLLYKSNAKKLLLLAVLPLLVFTVLLRPNGFLLAGSLVLYFIVYAWHTNKYVAKLLIGATGVAAVGLLFFLNSNIAAFVEFFKLSYLNGEIICGYNGLTISPDNNLTYEDDNYTLSVVYELISADVLYFFRLALAKFFFLFSDVRPYYTLSHNLYIVGFLAVVYTLMFRNVWGFIQKQPALFVFLGSFILLNAGLIMITYTDWDGRFLAPLIGPMLLIAGGVDKGKLKPAGN